jgi:hypothetical protein
MAKRTIHVLVDDLDGGRADETVRFALDGVQYEIDLSAQNVEKLRGIFARYLAAGSRVGRSGPVAASPRRPYVRLRSINAGERDQNRAIRAWAHSKGLAVSARGRIRREIVDKFNLEAGK